MSYINFSLTLPQFILKKKSNKEQQNELKKVVGDAWIHPSFVFTDGIGRYIDYCVVNKKLKKLLKENDLPEVTTHALRHTNASLMINSGISLKCISDLLGHCNTEITSNIYVHIFKEYKAKMAETIEHDLL